MTTNAARPARPGLGLVYIIGTYPSTTVTFIDREIRALKDQGFTVTTLAARPPVGLPLSTEQQQSAQDVIYLLPEGKARSGKFLASQLVMLGTRPVRYFRALAFLLTRRFPEGRGRLGSHRLMALLHFLQGVLAAYLLRHHHFDELHSQFADRAATIALVAGRLLGRTYTLSIHAGPDVFVEPVLLGEKVREARRVVTCTASIRDHLLAEFGEELVDKVFFVPHGVDLDEFRVTPSEPNTPPVLLTVAQLFERKGVRDLVRACGILKSRSVEFVCRIMGDGPERETLQAMIQESGLEKDVVLEGAASVDGVRAAYGSADIFVLPCTEAADGDIDGIPNVLAEAMASGLPVITTPTSGIPELVHDQTNGVLVPPNDPEALAEGISTLLEDLALRERLSRAARQTVGEKFDLRTNVERLRSALWPSRPGAPEEHGCR